MILLSLGLPGHLAEWCDAVLALLARRLGGGDVLVATWPPLQDVFNRTESGTALAAAALGLIRSNASHVVLGARQPDEGLYAALLQTNSSFVLALDDPRNAVADVFAAANGALASITGAVASACPLLARFASLPGAFVVRRGGDPAAHLVSAMAGHLGLAPSEAEIAGIVAELDSAGLSRALTLERQWHERIPEAGHKLVDGALGAYAEASPGEKLGQIVWRRELFLSADKPGTSLTDTVSLVGPPRHIVFGPYIRLPQGSWNARVLLGISPEGVGQLLMIDVYAGGQLTSTMLRPHNGGIYTVELNFAVAGPVSDRAELRIQLPNGAVRGELAFGQVVLTHVRSPVSDALSEVQGDFRAVLVV